MKLIAHRGLCYGPDSLIENKPSHIEDVLSKGFDCEIDLWCENNEFWLGHDSPVYHIREEFLHKKGLWIHAKNLSALYQLSKTELNYFWHESDCFTLTSHGYIWTYPGQNLTEHSVCVMPENIDPSFKNLPKHCYAICSDYISNPNFQQLLALS